MAMNCVIIISNIINKLYNYYTLHTMTTDNQSVSQSMFIRVISTIGICVASTLYTSTSQEYKVPQV